MYGGVQIVLDGSRTDRRGLEVFRGTRSVLQGSRGVPGVQRGPRDQDGFRRLQSDL